MKTDVALRWARTPLTPERRALSLALLSAAERTRESTDGFLAGRLLLRELARELRGGPVGITAACPDCGREHGQPRVDGLFASIAHADDLVVVAASTGGAIGVDVERDDAEVPTIFANGVAGWTALESVLKADGRGLRLDPSAVVITGEVASLGDATYVLTYVDTAPGFTTAVALADAPRATTSRTGRQAALR